MPPMRLRACALFSTLAVAAPLAPVSSVLAAEPAVAPAADDPRARAAALYKEGAGLFRENRFKEAAEKFEAAYALDPSPILLYNLARAAEEQGDGAKSIFHYRTYLASYPQAEDRAEVERRIRVLEKVTKPQTASLGLIGVPADATVVVNDKPAPAPGTDGRFTLEPGRHVVRVTTTSGGSGQREVTLQPGDSAQLDFTGVADGALAAPYEGGLRPWGWAAVGVGAGAAIAGIVFGLQSQAAAEDYDAIRKDIATSPRASDPVARAAEEAAYRKKLDAARTDTEDNSLRANIGYGVGGALLVTGAVLLVLDATRRADAAAYDQTPTATLVPLPGGFGMGFGARF